MLDIIGEYARAYFIHVFALIPIAGFLMHCTSRKAWRSLWFNKPMLFYYIVVFAYIYFNIFTIYPAIWIGPLFANLAHVVLCIFIFIDTEY